jgi:hypothetical protein
VPNSLVTCPTLSPRVSVVPRAWDPDQNINSQKMVSQSLRSDDDRSIPFDGGIAPPWTPANLIPCKVLSVRSESILAILGCVTATQVVCIKLDRETMGDQPRTVKMSQPDDSKRWRIRCTLQHQ